MCISPVFTDRKKYIKTVTSGKKTFDVEMYRGQTSNAYNPRAYFPCGKCFQCKQQKIEEWQIRWKEQLKTSAENSSYLLTLTYNDENLPYIQYPDGTTLSTLNYSDVTKFLKRLRKKQDSFCKKFNVENPKITYHGCGEYGTRNTKRPHYHLLITNLIIPINLVQSIWSHGTVHIGNDVTENTIKYCLKYTLKHSLTGQDKIKLYHKDVTVIESPAFTGESSTQITQTFTYKSDKMLFIQIDTEQKDAPLLNSPSINFETVKKTYICTIIKKGHKNGLRIAEKTFCSKGIGKDFLDEKTIQFYRENPDTHYLWHDVKKNQYKTKPLPRYYREIIFNPKQKDETGKMIRDEYYRPIPIYNPLSPDYENTPRFRKQLLSWKNQQKKICILMENINTFGLDKYIELHKHERNEKIYKFNTEQTLYNAKLEFNSKMYCYD